MVATMRSASKGMCMQRRMGKSSGKLPLRGRIELWPQFWRRLTSRMRTSSISPGSAPLTATGPVMKWPGLVTFSARMTSK